MQHAGSCLVERTALTELRKIQKMPKHAISFGCQLSHIGVGDGKARRSAYPSPIPHVLMRMWSVMGAGCSSHRLAGFFPWRQEDQLMAGWQAAALAAEM